MNLRVSRCLIATCLFAAIAVAQPLTPPIVSKIFGSASIPLNGTTVMQITIANLNANAALTGVGLTDVLPPGLSIQPPLQNGPFCGGTIAMTASSITFTGLTLDPGGAGCGAAVTVKGIAPGVQTNTTSVATSAEAGEGPGATATLTVTAPALAAPQLTKDFGGIVSIPLGATTALNFQVANPNPTDALTGVSFTDVLPPGLVIAAGPAAPAPCNGTPITAVPGTNVISVSGVTLPPASACKFTVQVTATAAGLLTNTSGAVTSENGGTGNAAAAAIAVGDIYEVRYAANLPLGDSFFDLTNTGASGGNICANVYVFSPDEQLISCCACPITPNALRSLSARSDAVVNPLTPAVPSAVVVKLVSSSPQAGCNAATVTPAALTAGLAAWAATPHSVSGGAVSGVTETPFANSRLSAAELSRITALCGFIQANGSGYGICRSCRLGAQGADKR